MHVYQNIKCLYLKSAYNILTNTQKYSTIVGIAEDFIVVVQDNKSQ